MSGMRSAAPPACRTRGERHGARTDKTPVGGRARPRTRCRVRVRRRSAAARRWRSAAHLPRPDRHQPRGFANLAGQYAAVIYKELHDFRSGAPQQCRDVAVCRQPDGRGNRRSLKLLRISAAASGLSPDAAIAEAQHRDLRRADARIAPCGACHGSLDNKTGSPWLEGQSEAYMKAQLQAFAGGERRNDISQQMRNIARTMTPQEIERGRGLLRLAAAGYREGGGLIQRRRQLRSAVESASARFSNATEKRAERGVEHRAPSAAPVCGSEFVGRGRSRRHRRHRPPAYPRARRSSGSQDY